VGKIMKGTVWIAGVSLLVKLLGSLILMQIWAERGLASANVLAAVVQSVLLWLALNRHRSGVSFADLLPAFGKILAAAVVMGLFCWGGLAAVNAAGLQGKIDALVSVGLLVPGGIVVYFILLHQLRLDELRFITDKLKRILPG